MWQSHFLCSNPRNIPIFPGIYCKFQLYIIGQTLWTCSEKEILIAWTVRILQDFRLVTDTAIFSLLSLLQVDYFNSDRRKKKIQRQRKMWVWKKNCMSGQKPHCIKRSHKSFPLFFYHVNLSNSEVPKNLSIRVFKWAAKQNIGYIHVLIFYIKQ